jgi:hypothetical protein
LNPPDKNTRIAWEFVDRHLPGVIPWAAVLFGIDQKWCGWDVARGRAERGLAHSDDERLVKIAIASDRWEANDSFLSVCAESPLPPKQAERIWLYLALEWIYAGHDEPGPHPVPEAATRDVIAGSVADTLEMTSEVAFLTRGDKHKRFMAKPKRSTNPGGTSWLLFCASGSTPSGLDCLTPSGDR